MIEITCDGFKAVVTPFRKMPIQKILIVLNEPEGMRQFTKGLELLRDEIATELHSDFDSLGFDEASELMTQWFGAEDED